MDATTTVQLFKYFSKFICTYNLQLLIISESFYILTMITIKISLGIFFLRIMVQKWQKRTIYAIVTVSTLIGLAYFFLAIFQCGFPVEAQIFWQRRVAGQCMSKSIIFGMSYTHAVVTAATDILLGVLPITIVKEAKINHREKRIIIGIFVIALA
jgi:hypothetical protein